jgi:thymidylate kinase
MIVIVEGIDRVGKTTLCDKLKDKGFIIFKDIWFLHKFIKDKATFSVGKLDATLSFLQVLYEQDLNVVCDRLHLTEYVYGTLERETNKD